jgi:hypothetical protein
MQRHAGQQHVRATHLVQDEVGWRTEPHRRAPIDIAPLEHGAELGFGTADLGLGLCLHVVVDTR